MDERVNIVVELTNIPRELEGDVKKGWFHFLEFIEHYWPEINVKWKVTAGEEVADVHQN